MGARPGYVVELVLALLLATSLVAAEPANAKHALPSTAGQVGAHLAFSGGMVAATGLSLALVYVPSRIQFETAGRPEPLVLAGALLLTGAVHVALTELVLPELYRLGGGTPDLATTHSVTWEYS